MRYQGYFLKIALETRVILYVDDFHMLRKNKTEVDKTTFR